MYKECVPQDLIRVDHSRNKRENLCEIKKQPKSSLNFYWSSSKTKKEKTNKKYRKKYVYLQYAKQVRRSCGVCKFDLIELNGDIYRREKMKDAHIEEFCVS